MEFLFAYALGVASPWVWSKYGQPLFDKYVKPIFVKAA
jgi:hypothetical protein